MAFSIQEFKSAVNKFGGLARTAHYEVNIPVVFQGAPVNSKDVSMFADQATIPGLNYQTNEFRYSGYGKMEKRPYMAAYTDASMTFLVDAEGRMKEFFDKWLLFINEFRDDQVSAEADTFRFPSEYVADVTVTMFDVTGNPTTEVKLFRCFPITVGDVSVSWGERNTLFRLPVQFTYNSWTTNKL